MKTLTNISRILTGLLFMFSGLTKGIDPVGSMIKITDYFSAAGISVPGGMALVLGVMLCTAEFIIGFSVLAGMRIRPASWGMLAFMILFTPLTFVLALFNPVSDCGCFGDAIHLSNWETFFKNVIILTLVIIVFARRKTFHDVHTPVIEWRIIIAATLLFTAFVSFNKRNLPVVDFRPYNIGRNIPEGMTMPEGEAYDQYNTTLIYSKNGVEKEFTLENYPSGDTSWVFVDQKTELVKKGYTPPIHNFSLATAEGDDLTDLVIYDPGYSLLMISPNMQSAHADEIEKGIRTGEYLLDNQTGFYIVTSASNELTDTYKENFTVLFADETTIKTMIRSNPGYMLLKGGVVMAKWSPATLPPATRIAKMTAEGYSLKRAGKTVRFIIVFGVAIILSLLTKFLPKE